MEAIGRPILMLYPLYLAANDILNIASEFEVKKTVSLSSVVQLGRLFVMSMAILQISNILTMYSGVGYTCLAAGFLALFISSNDELTKHFVPILAPHIAHAGTFFAKLSHLEQMALSTLSLSTANAAAVAATATATASRTSEQSSSVAEARRPSPSVTDPRVEELPDDPPTPLAAPAASSSAPGRASQVARGISSPPPQATTAAAAVVVVNLGGEEEEDESGYVLAEAVEVEPAAMDIAGAVCASFEAGDGLRQRRR